MEPSGHNTQMTNPHAMDCLNATRVMIFGKQGTGRTTLYTQLYRYIHSRYPKDTFRSLKRFIFNNDKATFVVSDADIPWTSIKNRNRVHNISKGDAFILVYSLDDERSFDYIEAVKDAIIRQKGENVPIVIIGNKSDLQERAIQYPIVDCLVTIEWEMKYLEMSALNRNSFPPILELLLPNKIQTPDLPASRDLETCEWRVEPLRPRSATVPVNTVRSYEREYYSGEQYTFPEQRAIQVKRRRFSVSNFLKKKWFSRAQ